MKGFFEGFFLAIFSHKGTGARRHGGRKIKARRHGGTEGKKGIKARESV